MDLNRKGRDSSNAFTLAIELVNYSMAISSLSRMDATRKAEVLAERRRNLKVLKLALNLDFDIASTAEDSIEQFMAVSEEIAVQLEVTHSRQVAQVFRLGTISALVGMLWIDGRGMPEAFVSKIEHYGQDIGVPKRILETWARTLRQSTNSQAVVIDAFKMFCGGVYEFFDLEREETDATDEAGKLKILLLTADPSNAARLRLGQELRDIREKLQLARIRHQLETRTSVRPSDLIQAVLDTEPQIVHFSGHGTSSGELCLENALGKIQTVTPDALASLFELVADQVKCVVLNACYAESQAKAIAEHIDYVIGMKKEISDEAAIAFATGFYRALGAGRSVDEAYKFGVVELKLLKIPEHLTPVLIKKQL